MDIDAITLSAILTDIGSIVTSAITWMTSFMTFITDNPLVLLMVLVPLVGLGVGLIARLLRG